MHVSAISVLELSQKISETFLACSFVKLSSSFPTHYFLLFICSWNQVCMFWSLVHLSTGSSNAESLCSPFSLPVCYSPGWKLLLLSPYVSSSDPWNPWWTATYTSDTPHWLKLLCVLSLRAENYRHVEMASYFWEHCLDCYLPRVIHTKSKGSLSRRHSIIPLHTGHGPLVRTPCHMHSPLHILPYSEGRKHWVEPRSFGELHSAELHICTSATCVLTWASSSWGQKLRYSSQLSTAW